MNMVKLISGDIYCIYYTQIQTAILLVSHSKTDFETEGDQKYNDSDHLLHRFGWHLATGMRHAYLYIYMLWFACISLVTIINIKKVSNYRGYAANLCICNECNV